MSCPVTNDVLRHGMTTDTERLNDLADDIWWNLTPIEILDAMLELDTDDLHDNILCKVAIMVKQLTVERNETAYDLTREIERLLRPEMLKRAQEAIDNGFDEPEEDDE